MVSTRWFQGIDNIEPVINIRKEFFMERNNEDCLLRDIYDEFAFNVVVYEEEVPAGCGRLLFKEGKYFIDNICVLKKYVGKKYEELIVRMLVRRAINMGAENTYSLVEKDMKDIFESIGFVEFEEDFEQGKILMIKTGDVSGHCCNK